jgi:hypothetical protein
LGCGRIPRITLWSIAEVENTKARLTIESGFQIILPPCGIRNLTVNLAALRLLSSVRLGLATTGFYPAESGTPTFTHVVLRLRTQHFGGQASALQGVLGYHFWSSSSNRSGVISISRRISLISGRERSLPGRLGSVVVLPSACL